MAFVMPFFAAIGSAAGASAATAGAAGLALTSGAFSVLGAVQQGRQAEAEDLPPERIGRRDQRQFFQLAAMAKDQQGQTRLILLRETRHVRIGQEVRAVLVIHAGRQVPILLPRSHACVLIL